jgi:S1-C subfamily serine protease
MVTHIKILSDLFGKNMGGWIGDQGIRKWVESGMSSPAGVKIYNQEDSIETKELADIVNSRTPKRSSSFTLAYGEPDFLQYGFLGRALRCGSAVCRLVRDYSRVEDQDIEYIIQVIKEREYGKRELSELLSIEDAFWGDNETLLAALEDTNFKEKLKEKLKRPIAVGTGFLVGRNYLLTNHHVLDTEAKVQQFSAEFRYEIDYLGNEGKKVQYELDSSFFKTDEKLDYTLVKVKRKTDPERRRDELAFWEAGDNFGWLPMSEDPTVIAPPLKGEKRKIFLKQVCEENLELNPYMKEKLGRGDLAGEPAIIIQHPKGRYKEIVLFNNQIQEIYRDFFQYESDADLGSSGSPVFNLNFQLVGLHHAALVNTENAECIGNLGVRVSQIVKSLKQKSKEDIDIEKLLYKDEKCVILNDDTDSRRVKRGRIFVAISKIEETIDLTAEKSHLLDEKYEASQKQKALLQELVVSEMKKEQFAKYGFEVIKVPASLSNKETIKFLNEEYEYRAGDIALEIHIHSRPKQPEVRGATVFYIAKSQYAERKIHSELMLSRLLKQVPALSSLSVTRPDTAAKSEGLDFCRKVVMPSVRMTVGLVTNDEDWKLITEQSQKMAEGIANGLIAWANTLSPVVYVDKSSQLLTS